MSRGALGVGMGGVRLALDSLSDWVDDEWKEEGVGGGVKGESDADRECYCGTQSKRWLASCDTITSSSSSRHIELELN